MIAHLMPVMLSGKGKSARCQALSAGRKAMQTLPAARYSHISMLPVHQAQEAAYGPGAFTRNHQADFN